MTMVMRRVLLFLLRFVLSDQCDEKMTSYSKEEKLVLLCLTKMTMNQKRTQRDDRQQRQGEHPSSISRRSLVRLPLSVLMQMMSLTRKRRQAWLQQEPFAAWPHTEQRPTTAFVVKQSVWQSRSRQRMRTHRQVTTDQGNKTRNVRSLKMTMATKEQALWLQQKKRRQETETERQVAVTICVQSCCERLRWGWEG